MKLDLSIHSNVREAIRLYSQALNKTITDVTNRMLSQILWHANFLTHHRQDIWPIRKIDEPLLQTIRGKLKKSKKNKIVAQRFRVYQSSKSGGAKARSRGSKTPEAAHALFYALAKKANPGAKNNAISTAAHRIWSKRRNGKGYTANSWAPAIETVYPSTARRLEKARRGSKWNKSSKGVAKQAPAGGIPATRYLTTAPGTSTAPAVEVYGPPAVQTGAGLAAADTHDYAIKKLMELSQASRNKNLRMVKM